MKKAFAMILVASMVLAGCGSSSSTSSEAASDSSASNSTEAAPAASSDEVYTITLTHSTTEETSQQAGSLAFKEYVEANSDGRLSVNIFPNSQMGGDREQLEGLQEGSITMVTCGSAATVNFVQSAIVFDLPFAFASNEEVLATFGDADFLEAISAEYAQSKFKFMGISGLDFRATTSNMPIETPDDLSGFTIRVMENQYHMATWKALGANPTPLAFNELYTALQQKTVDGQENPVELIYAQKFYEQQEYVTKTKHIPQNLVWVMNIDFYNNLPADLQAVVDAGAAAAMDAAYEFTTSNQATYEAELTSMGVTINELSAEQIAVFAEKTQEVWEMIEADSSPEVYNAYVAAMNK